MIVLKFGGSSVANAENIKKVVKVIQQPQYQHAVVIVSALGGVTDLLLQLGNNAANGQIIYKEQIITVEKRHLDTVQALLPINNQSACISQVKQHFNELEDICEGVFRLGELSNRTKDRIVSFGELLSSKIICYYAAALGLPIEWLDSRLLIETNSNYTFAAVNFLATEAKINATISNSSKQLFIAPGFIAADGNGFTTTLGRGGSDYTAAIFANALQASSVEIWTDVTGMMTADPRWVSNAKTIPHTSYREAMELSHFGAKVLYPPTIQPVLRKNIPILIKNTFEPEAEGTFISNTIAANGSPVKGISHIDNITLITLEGSGMIGVAGSSKRLFEVLSNENINVIFITQASSEHSICIGILNSDAENAEIAINKAFEIEIAQNKIEPCLIEKKLCIIALVGENMKNHQGLSGRMFSTLGKNNVNIRAIAQGASERNISVVINERDVKKALNTLHENFFEENTKQLNLFVMGVGNVGEKFMEQIHQQKKFLKENLKINLRVIAVSNSRNMYFEEDGISLKEWASLLATGEPANAEAFIAKVKELNLRNSIFVDITANESVSKLYEQFLRQNVAVVTCNKIACSSAYANYQNLKNLSRKYNAPFLFETNVGAGLPIIDTVKNLIASGDKVHKIQAVLSGSLNFIFNNFGPNYSFHDVVKEAGVQGFTEPDPKIDLSGVDVARKILILIRESGYQMEIEDIENLSFLPDECMKTNNNDDFFKSLLKNASH
ncbi:MAG: bifunctional aspartate kinase/homoserine dehydrogenase I, partial [Flavobacterium sp.]